MGDVNVDCNGTKYLHNVRWRDMESFLLSNGFERKGKQRGSHQRYENAKTTGKATLIKGKRAKPVGIGILMATLQRAKLDTADLIAALGRK